MTAEEAELLIKARVVRCTARQIAISWVNHVLGEAWEGGSADEKPGINMAFHQPRFAFNKPKRASIGMPDVFGLKAIKDPEGESMAVS